MTNKKRTWKYWLSRILLAAFLIGIIWLINLTWFRPFNIRHFYDRVFVELVLQSPETITLLGVPFLYDWTKDKLDDVSDDKLWKDLQKIKKDYTTLLSYNYDRQSLENQLNTKILGAYLKNEIEREQFFYHEYPVHQWLGVQNNLPKLLSEKHKLRNKSDVQAYITRLEEFETKFNQVLEGLKIREEKGIIPPQFVIEKVLNQMNGFVSDGVEKNILYTNFQDKADKIKELSQEEKAAFEKQIAHDIQFSVFSAYQKLIDYHEILYTKANTDDGVWKLPNGNAYYRYLLKKFTTTDLSPEDVYQIGLSEVGRIQKEMWAILNNEGYTDTTKNIGAIIQALNQEERFLFPENDSGRAMVLTTYRRIIDEAIKSIEPALESSPTTTLKVERVPEFLQDDLTKTKYNGGTIDGSRDAVLLVNLRKVSEHPKYAMKALAYAACGTHYQMDNALRLKGLPVFRTVIPFEASRMGWDMYTEQLAYEMGFYENDPFGNLGRLQAEMLKTVRLIVDVGIHYKKWSREEAINYMVELTGMNESEAVTEVEKFIVLPGLSCAATIGRLKTLELREKVKQELGPKFDLRKFHRVILENGAVPLDVLEEIVEKYIQAK
jgi:uncharacterized protein (DUF885 family)